MILLYPTTEMPKVIRKTYELDADAFEKQHNMQTYRAYHAQCTVDNDEMLEKYPVVEE